MPSRSIPCFIALIACNIAVASAQSIDDTRLAAAFDTQDRCFNDKATELDDGVSDALTVGTAIADECKLETVQLGLLLFSDGTKEANNRSVGEMVDRAPRQAALAVLQRRGQVRTGSNYSPTKSSGNHPISAGYDVLRSKEDAARDQLTTGVHLKEACEQRGQERAKCSAFIRGVMFAYRAGVQRASGDAPYCTPEPYFASMWTNDVVEFLNTNPQYLESPAQGAVILALENKYPCTD